jgi:hypothetical protein
VPAKAGNINAAKYIEILEDNLWPIIVRHYTEENYIFQDDNAPVHRAWSVQNYKTQNNINGMLWPAQSPEPLNVIQLQIIKLILALQPDLRHWGSYSSPGFRHTKMWLFSPMMILHSSEDITRLQSLSTVLYLFPREPKQGGLLHLLLGFNGVGTLATVNGNINIAKYIEILEDNLWPVIVRHYPEENYIFQDDNTPVQRARSVQDYNSRSLKCQHHWM